MKEGDFYKLNIKQKIYHEGREKIISGLSGCDGDRFICFSNEFASLVWNVICEKCSLEPPKEKKKYWRWAIRTAGTPSPVMTESFYDDYGMNPQGIWYNKAKWNQSLRKKDESFVWEE